MGLYFLKLLILLPLLGGLIWGSLWLTKRMQRHINVQRAGSGKPERAARLVETTMLSPGVKLAVVEFRGREILVGSTRHGLTRLAEVDIAQSADFARAVEDASAAQKPGVFRDDPFPEAGPFPETGADIARKNGHAQQNGVA